MSFWAWALQAYDRPGAAQACLDLQDLHGQNTAFLLWALWCGCDDAAVVSQAADLARHWDKIALAPVRAARRALKASLPPMSDSLREASRQQVKTAELALERALMDTLAELVPAGPDGTAQMAHLKGAVVAWGRPAPEAALRALIEALA